MKNFLLDDNFGVDGGSAPWKSSTTTFICNSPFQKAARLEARELDFSSLEELFEKVFRDGFQRDTEDSSVLDGGHDGEDGSCVGEENIPPSLLDEGSQIEKVFHRRGGVDHKNPFVFMANRLTFLMKTKFPIVFDTSCIEAGDNWLKVAVDEGKTYPRISSMEDLGFITSEANQESEIQEEIRSFLEGTVYNKIYCFPDKLAKDGVGDISLAVKFVMYPHSPSERSLGEQKS